MCSRSTVQLQPKNAVEVLQGVALIDIFIAQNDNVIVVLIVLVKSKNKLNLSFFF